MEDALLYLDQVKVEFGDRPHIYNEFLDIMKTFKTQQIDTPGVIRRVSNLFQGNKRLVLGFNTFLPEGYKIELPLDGDGPPIAVFRAPGETITHILGPPAPAPAPASGEALAAQGAGAAAAAGRAAAGVPPHVAAPLRGGPPHPHAPPSSLGRSGPLGQHPGAGFPPPIGVDIAARARLEQARAGAPPIPGRGPHVPAAGRPGLPGVGQQPGTDSKVPARVGQGGQHIPGHPGAMQQLIGVQGAQAPPQAAASPPSAAGAQPQQPLEFDHAINYVTTIKKRFATEPETYKKFLEILHTYQKEQRGIKEVLEEVSVLFADHPDLLKEFTYFLPDAVQAEAKAQLDQAAKESEERKARQMAQKQSIIAQGMQRSPLAVSSSLSVPLPTTSASVPHREIPVPSGPAAIQIPFGATQGRSVEREREIYRSAVYGSVSFAPTRPPRKHALTIAQAAAKNGRPSMLPPLPKQTTTAETSFFDKAKRHLNRKELAPDKPSGSRRHTPYTEFLKCLHLFGAGILNKDELVLLLRGLFMQGHAPKSGVNAGGGASNPSIANDAHELLKEFEEVSSKV